MVKNQPNLNFLFFSNHVVKYLWRTFPVMISSYLRQYYCHEIKILTDKPGTTVLEERGERLKLKRKVQREEKGYEEIFLIQK